MGGRRSGPQAALATAEAAGVVDGITFLDAVVRGYEAMIRVGRAAGEGVLGVLAFEGQVEVEPQVAAAFAETVARAQTLGLKVETVRLPDYNFGRMRRLGLLIS